MVLISSRNVNNKTFVKDFLIITYCLKNISCQCQFKFWWDLHSFAIRLCYIGLRFFLHQFQIPGVWSVRLMMVLLAESLHQKSDDVYRSCIKLIKITLHNNMEVEGGDMIVYLAFSKGFWSYHGMKCRYCMETDFKLSNKVNNICLIHLSGYCLTHLFNPLTPDWRPPTFVIEVTRYSWQCYPRMDK